MRPPSTSWVDHELKAEVPFLKKALGLYFLISWFYTKNFKLRTMNHSHLLFRNMNNLAQSLPRRALDAIILRDTIRAQSGTMGRRLGVPPSLWRSHLTNSPLHTHRPITPAGVTAPQFPSPDLSMSPSASFHCGSCFFWDAVKVIFFPIWILIYDWLWIYIYLGVTQDLY